MKWVLIGLGVVALVVVVVVVGLYFYVTVKSNR